MICIDLGPQANITMSIGCHNPDELQHTIADGIDLMLSSIQLSGYETLLINEYDRENMLCQHVDAARPCYDHILIDCQLSLNILTINAMVAADNMLIPTYQSERVDAAIIQIMHDIFDKMTGAPDEDRLKARIGEIHKSMKKYERRERP